MCLGSVGRSLTHITHLQDLSASVWDVPIIMGRRIWEGSRMCMGCISRVWEHDRTCSGRVWEHDRTFSGTLWEYARMCIGSMGSRRAVYGKCWGIV